MANLNSAGASHARSLVASGHVDKTAAWSFSADDGNALLGPNGDDWANYATWFLGEDTSATPKTKDRYKYPFGKGGTLYRSALTAIRQRAGQQNDDAVFAEAGALLDKIDGGKAFAPDVVPLPEPKKPAVKRDLTRAQHVFTPLEQKSVDETPTHYVIKGVASTPRVDRMGDIVEPMGAQYERLPKLQLYHDSTKPIGNLTKVSKSAAGIPFEAAIPKVSEPGTVKDRIDEAVHSVKYDLLSYVSIGFQPLDYEPISARDPLGAQRFKTWDFLELSLVTIPANPDAVITGVKSIDDELRAARRANADASSPAATGPRAKQSVAITPPGVSGKPPSKRTEQSMATFTEQIKSLEATRAAKDAQVTELINTAAAEGRTFEAEEQQQHDDLVDEIKSIDKHLGVLRAAVERVKSSAAPVDPAAAGSPERAHDVVKHGEFVVRTNANLPKGIGLARYAKALAQAKGNYPMAIDYAKQWDSSTPDVVAALKSAISAGTSSDSAWAGPLVYNTNLVNEFVEFLRPQTIIGKMDGFRRVPFNVRFPIQSAGSTVAWTGEGSAKPVSKLQFTSGTLGFAKASGIVVVTQELARFSSPSAELLVRNDMAAQMIEFLDQQFIDPSILAVASTNPASITAGAGNITTSAATWTSQANVLADIKAFLQGFASNNIQLDGTSYWVMTPSVALALSMIVTANGVQAFPDVTVDGGTLFGIKVITSNSVPATVSGGTIVAIVKASEVFLADDGQVAIDVSQEASLQMDTAPTNSSGSPTATTVVSMFQTNSLAIRCERVVNWLRRRSYGAGYIDAVHTS